MKKMIFSAAAFGLVAATGIALAPTNAEAIPAFARQTGAACLSCHFQTIPALASFGRAFKKGAFTDVGDEALVEDDNLSIPAVLNATMVIRANYTNTKTTNTQASATYTIPTDVNFLVAGRIGSNTGAFIEFGGGAGAAASSSANNWQFMNSFDMGGFKIGVGAYNTSFGGDAGMTTSNVYGQHAGKLAGVDVSAINDAGFDAQTAGIDVWGGNDMGYVYFGLIAPNAAAGGAVNVGFKFAKLIRAVANFDVAGWDSQIGGGLVTGTAGKGTTAAPVAIPMDLQFIDAQFQGAVGDTSIGIYADWAHAKGKTDPVSGTGNFYGANGGGGNANLLTGQKFDSYGGRIEVKPFSRVLFGVGYMSDKQTSATAGNPAIVHKKTHLAATYEVYQNMEINLVYNTDKQSGGGTAAAPTASTTTNTTLVEVLALM